MRLLHENKSNCLITVAENCSKLNAYNLSNYKEPWACLVAWQPMFTETGKPAIWVG